MRHALRLAVFPLVICLLLAGFSAACAGYYLQEKDGRLAVWDCAANDWYEITDVPVSSLPNLDRSALKNGIFCAGQSELASRLEDYCG